MDHTYVICCLSTTHECYGQARNHASTFFGGLKKIYFIVRSSLEVRHYVVEGSGTGSAEIQGHFHPRIDNNVIITILI